MDFLGEQKEKELLSKAAYLASSFGTEFTIHALHIDSKIEEIRIDFSTNNAKNFTVMEKVIEIAAKIGAEYIVVHPGSQSGSKKCLNLNLLILYSLYRFLGEAIYYLMLKFMLVMTQNESIKNSNNPDSGRRAVSWMRGAAFQRTTNSSADSNPLRHC